MPALPETELQKVTAQEQYTQAYRFMLVARLLEEKLASLYRAGLIKGGVFLGRGQEAFSVSLGLHLRRGDIYAPLIRDQAGRMAFGDSISDTLRTYLGSQLGPMRGRDGNIHRGSPERGYYAMISHLGAMISVVVGGLMAKRLRGESGIVGGSCIGEGGTSTGAFHEGINVAAVERVPLVLLIANNQYAYSTPVSRQFACKNLIDKAVGYGLRGHEVDGTNLEECLRVVGEAVRVAREGGGPQLVVGTLLRLVGHGEHDDASYVDPVHYQAAYGRDCMHIAERTLVERSWLSRAELMEWRREISLEVELLSAKVLREPVPDPSEEDWSAISNVELRDSYSER
jgi:acetoin:2,6-dichlorophenolindophenol oxidoreductase subunit alpha